MAQNINGYKNGVSWIAVSFTRSMVNETAIFVLTFCYNCLSILIIPIRSDMR